MKNRYASLFTSACLLLSAQAQTVLTLEEYDDLKGHDHLPSGSIVITGYGQTSTTPAAWLQQRGGGGACECWIAPDANYVSAMNENDDNSSALISLPFTLNLFGQPYTSLYINNNGNVSFDQPYSTYSALGFPSTDFIMLAPFWGDVDTRDTTTTVLNDFLHGQVLYRITPTAMYVNWVDVGYYANHGDLRNSFQLILTDGTDPVVPYGNVSYCYQDMQWTTGDASGGAGGFGGSPAVVGANVGDGINYSQIGLFDTTGTQYYGTFTDTSGVDWLDQRELMFNTALGQTVPPILSVTNACDTFVVPVTESFTITVVGIPGVPGNDVSMTSESLTLDSWMEFSNTPGDPASITGGFTAQVTDIGMHEILFTVIETRDDVESTMSIWVEVIAATDVPETIVSDLSISPNPASDQVVLGWSQGNAPTLIEVVAADGRTTLAVRPNAQELKAVLSLAGLAPGAYSVRATRPTGISTSRLVKAGE